MRVYLDQNAWLQASREFESGEFQELLNHFDAEPLVSTQTLHEFIRGFYSARQSSQTAVQRVFTLLSEIDIGGFLRVPDELIRNDVEYLRWQIRSPRTYGYLKRMCFKREIARLAMGFSDEGVCAVEAFESDIKYGTPLFIDEVRAANAIGADETEAEFLQNPRARRRIIEKSSWGAAVLMYSDSTLFRDPSNLPFINCYINVQLFLNFRVLANHNFNLVRDTHDLKHLFNANAADLFVTNDRGLRNRSSRLCPWLSCCTFENFKKLAQRN
ncbi:MAG: hypothetical protein ACR2IE_04280 [Candidatus Sumerlaeaceae bacterium]